MDFPLAHLEKKIENDGMLKLLKHGPVLDQNKNFNVSQLKM